MAFTNKVAINIHRVNVRWTCVFLFGKYLGVKFLDLVIRECTSSDETVKDSANVVVPFTFPQV